MGFVFSKLFNKLFNADREYKIILVGLHNAGKTTILYKLSLGEVVVTQPTIGSNVEEVNQDNVKLQVWDLGGQENLRSTWDTYYSNTDGVIYVIDSADDSNALVSQLEFFNLILNPELKGAPILVLANKTDRKGAKTMSEITDSFKLHDIKEHEWHIQS